MKTLVDEGIKWVDVVPRDAKLLDNLRVAVVVHWQYDSGYERPLEVGMSAQGLGPMVVVHLEVAATVVKGPEIVHRTGCKTKLSQGRTWTLFAI